MGDVVASVRHRVTVRREVGTEAKGILFSLLSATVQIGRTKIGHCKNALLIDVYVVSKPDSPQLFK